MIHNYLHNVATIHNYLHNASQVSTIIYTMRHNDPKLFTQCRQDPQQAYLKQSLQGITLNQIDFQTDRH